MKAKKRQFLQYVAEKSLQKTDFKGISFKKSKIIACKICKKLRLHYIIQYLFRLSYRQLSTARDQPLSK